MKCMNGSCGAPIQQSEAQLVLKVVLCRKCAKAVQLLRAQTRSELEVAVATLDDLLRFALTSGLPSDCHAAPLEFIAKVQKQCRSTKRTTSSSKSTKPSAVIADGNESSSNP